MRNILLILLLANVLFFVWGLLGNEDAVPGVSILNEADLGPPLNVTTNQDSESIANVGNAIEAAEPSALQAMSGPSCVSIGPFLDSDEADTVALEYANAGMRTAKRKSREETLTGHWVQIRDVADDAEARAMVTRLADGGLSDAYKVVTEDEGIKISLGLFRDLERAERVELQARSLDMPAEISPRLDERDVQYVDIRLAQGKGTGDMIERFGETKVQVRGRATCP